MRGANQIRRFATLGNHLPRHCGLDIRRFRPNIVVRRLQPMPFEEGDWVGGVLLFGDPSGRPKVSVTSRDVRCSMVNFDPDSGHSTPEVLKAVVSANQNNAGVYGTVVQTGLLAIGQTVRLSRVRRAAANAASA